MNKNNIRFMFDQINESAAESGRDQREISVVAVSKGRSIEEIKEAYSLGFRDFGENRVQEALEKMESLPKDIRWHFIGKLQKNKVKKVIGRFFLIHSVDTFELAKKISIFSNALDQKTSILLEVNTSGEETKSGMSPKIVMQEYENLQKLSGIEIKGLMTMAPFTKDREVIRNCFRDLRLLLEQMKLNELSMGMTNDFPIAISEGATLLRIGRLIFEDIGLQANESK